MTRQLELITASDAHGPDPVPDLAAADRIVFSRELPMAEVIRRSESAA